MWKKIAIGLITLIVAIFVALYWQINRAKTEITQYLNDNQITFKQLSFHLFPQPYFEFTKVKWHDAKVRSVFVENLNLQLNFSGLLYSQTRLKQFTFKQAQLWFSGQAEPDFKNINGYLNGEFFFQANQIDFNDLDLKIEFDSPILFNTKQAQLVVQKGIVQQLSETESKVILDDVNINGEVFTAVNAMLLKQDDSILFSSQIEVATRQPALQIELDIKNTQVNQQVTFAGKNIALAQWQNILNLPKFLSGNMQISGEMIFIGNKVQRGKAEIQIPHGQFNGINLLALVAKYLPINYDEQILKEKALMTPFQNLHSHFSWDTTQLAFKKLDFTIDKVSAAGEGRVNLANMQCDIVLNLGLTSPQYQGMKLPIRFFDHCYSPQYNVEFNKSLRNQLKNLLKEKFR